SAAAPSAPPSWRAGIECPAPPRGSPPCAASRGAELPLLRFLERLAVDAEGGDRTGLQALDADVLAALLALPLPAVVGPPQGLVYLGDELALAVADAEDEVPVALERGPVRRIRELLAGLAHAVDRTRSFGDELLAALVQELPEEIEFALPHGELSGSCTIGGNGVQSAGVT